MDFSKIYRASAVIIVIIAVFLGLKVLFPLCLPFLLGGLLSAAAEPAVRFGCEKCRLKRPLSAIFGVGLTLALVACGVILVGGLALREAKELTRFVPELQQSAQDGMQALEQSLLQLAGRLPDNLRATAEKTVTFRSLRSSSTFCAMPRRTMVSSVTSRTLPCGSSSGSFVRTPGPNRTFVGE